MTRAVAAPDGNGNSIVPASAGTVCAPTDNNAPSGSKYATTMVEVPELESVTDIFPTALFGTAALIAYTTGFSVK